MSLTWDQSRFDNVLEEYLKVTSRTMAEALNTKALFIARGATMTTKKVLPETIGAELGRTIRTPRTTKTGRTVFRRSLELTPSSQADAPLAALIVNARRGMAGEPGLYGKEMTAAIRRLLAARNRSIAFLRAGWLPAIRAMVDAGARGGPPMDSKARQYGEPKGRGTPAADNTETPVAIIENHAIGKGPRAERALEKWGGAGLTEAFNQEADSMEKYLEDKLAKDAAKANARLA